MNPAEAARVLKLASQDEELKVSLSSPAVIEDDGEDGLDLSPTERQFAEEYFGGDFAHNGTRSFMQVNKNANYNTSSGEASRLLKLPRVRRYLRKLNREAIEAFITDLPQDAELKLLAKAVVAAAARGQVRNRLALEAAIYLWNRFEGTPVQNVDVVVMSKERVAAATRQFLLRMTGQKKLSNPGSEVERESVAVEVSAEHVGVVE